MPIDLIINLLQSLTGSTFLQDKLKRSEYVIRVLKQLGLDLSGAGDSGIVSIGV
jgi:hypothetical protein